MNRLLKRISVYLVIGSTLLTPLSVFSTELDSTNYKIVGATTNGGGVIESASGDYLALLTAGTIANDPRIYSSLYEMYDDPQNGFIAEMPEVSCFETTTDGYSNCTTGPAEITTGGMVAICGAGGCYNRARFEIMENGNPTDTLYSIEISLDNFVSDIQYIDGSTYSPESSTTHNIDDFKTKSAWETETFNIQGLQASTAYYIRITALHGSFTQTDPCPSATATTASGSLYFDIDIDDSTGFTSETSNPYTLSFTGTDELIGGAAAMTATNRIWLDAESNSEGGFAIVIKGKYGGLYSSSTTQTITSATANLDSVLSGFGLQSEYVDYDDSSSLFGEISPTTDYSGSINSVGIVSTTATKIYDADGPIVDGRMGIKVVAKSDTNTTPATDYEEEISIVLVPRY